MALAAPDQTRLELLKNAPADQWVALAHDESRIVAAAETFEEVIAAAEAAGEPDPILLHVPIDWTPTTF